jgi:hypothetical protein
MTTIAWDGRYLVADTRETWDKSIPHYSRKLEMLTPDIIIGYAGSSYIYGDVKDFLLGKLPKPPKTIKDAEAIIIIEGTPYNWAGTEFRNAVRIYTPPHAIGSGWKYAWTMMKMGSSAVEAVKGASLMDIWTNDIVDIYDTKTKKLVYSPLPSPPARTA